MEITYVNQKEITCMNLTSSLSQYSTAPLISKVAAKTTISLSLETIDLAAS